MENSDDCFITMDLFLSAQLKTYLVDTDKISSLEDVKDILKVMNLCITIYDTIYPGAKGLIERGILIDHTTHQPKENDDQP